MSSSSHTRPRCSVYIDGFNLYFGVLKHRPLWKWLNLQSFSETLRSRESVEAVKYFTAIVDRKKLASERRERQELYIAALRTLPKVQVIEGVFQPKSVRCAGKCGEQYNVPEEKKTDVNIALAMVSDAIGGSVDSIVLISGDSDQEPAIQWICRNHPHIKLTVYVPVLPNERDSRRNDFYRSIGVPCNPLPLDAMPAHQLPNCVHLDKTHVAVRPQKWRAAAAIE